LTTSRAGPQAFFDVDKTITRSDTFLLLLRCALQEAPWRALFFVPLCPVFIVTALFRLEKRHAKGAALWIMTVGRSEATTQAWFAATIAKHAADLWLDAAEKELRALLAAGASVVFVTASAPEWISPLLASRGFASHPLIGTRIKRFAGGFCLAGFNCYGAEKVRRIEEAFGTALVWAHGYSDSYADAPMLERCEKRVLVSPTPAHLSAYEKRLGKSGFTCVDWRARMSRRITHPEKD